MDPGYLLRFSLLPTRREVQGLGPRTCLGHKGNLAKLSNIPESWFPHLQKEDNRRAYRMGLPWTGWNEAVGGGRSPGPVPGAHSARA